MRLPCILATLILSSCSASSWYPIVGSVAGGGVGAIAGPLGGAAGAGIGYAGGKTAQLFNENEELEATVTALTTGDVSALVEAGMAQHQTGFEEFTSYVKRILIIAACILGAYLSIPIFVARRTAESCSKTAAEKHLTRIPFPTNEKP
tara:strand:- start:91 stop:534 length:444 start_codon:yes stop_codon:yes gene_type:complete